MTRDLETKAAQKPLPFRGGDGGGGHQPSALPDTENKLHAPTPTPPLKGRGLSPADNDKRAGAAPLLGRGKNWNISAERLAELHARATEMRRNPTEPEKRLWRYLSNSQLEGHKFRRQSVIGYYIADFACPSANLIVEVDGDTHDDAKDRLRDDRLAEFGFHVIRVTNRDVMTNMGGVRAFIAEALREAERPHPNPSSGAESDAKRQREGLEGAHTDRVANDRARAIIESLRRNEDA